MKKTSLYIAVLSVFSFSGCSSHYAEPKIDMKPPRYVDKIPKRTNRMMVNNKGSLFGQGDNPLFSDRKAMNIDDIVTVVISEKTSQSSTGTKKLSEVNSNSLGGGVFSGGGTNIVGKTLKKINGYTDIGFKSGSDNRYKGSGTVKRDEKFTTTISARIVKILPNGNYFISGSRELLINGEKQDMRISGVIRPYDINQQNSIDSKYVADAKISYQTQGSINMSTNKGWGTKVVKSVWPFS